MAKAKSETPPPVRPAATWPFPHPLSKPAQDAAAEPGSAPTESFTRRTPADDTAADEPKEKP